MKKSLILSAVATAMAAHAAFADTPREVVQIKFNDGLVDYIPAADIDKISFSKGIDTQSPAYEKTIAMFDLTKAAFSVNNSHYDFGYPAIILGLDSQADDMYAPDSGYNWFSSWSKFDHMRNDGVPNGLMWRYMYAYIHAANETLKLLPAPASDEEKILAAQALAMRSFCYWNLAQTFAPNYHFAPDELSVPVITEANDSEAMTQNTPQPRATTRQVYELIMQDIDKAIDYLADNSLNPSYMDVENSKRYIDLSVAIGLRARYSLTMHDYEAAAKFARRAIDSSAATPLLIDAAGYPGFANAKAGNWMWGIVVNPDDRVATSGLVCFAAHMNTLVNYGYTQVEAPRSCGAKIWEYLENNPSDVRYNWFIDNTMTSATLTPAQQRRVWSANNLTRHANVKFDLYQSKINGSTRAEDIPLMRIEEMYLIAAEATAMAGNFAEAREMLNSFVRQYRDPEYTCSATSLEGLQNDILTQRRIELWGEGHRLFDMLRLQLDLDRYDTYADFNLQLRIKGGSRLFLYAIPQAAPFVAGYDYDSEAAEKPQPGENWNN